MLTDLIKAFKHPAVPTRPWLAKDQSRKQEATGERQAGSEEFP